MVWLSVARRAYEVYDLCISSLIKAAADCLEKSWHVDIFTYSDVSPQQLTVSLSAEFLFRRKVFNDASSVKTVFLSKQWKCLWEVAASGCKSKNSLVCFLIQDFFFCDKFHESNPLKNINNWKEMSTEHVKKQQLRAQWRVFLWVEFLQLRGACFRMCCLFDCLFTVCQLSRVLYCTSLCVNSTRSPWRLKDLLSFSALWDARPHKR